MKFILTIDTEADNQWDRSKKSLETNNIKELPKLQQLCDEYGVKPTYLITSEVAASPIAQDMLGPYQENGRAEIGAHLHPWTTEPFSSTGEEQSRVFANNLPVSVIEKKIQNLTQQIESGFGRRPTSYRAGRFGFDGESLRILDKLGYLVDCSVTPAVKWFDNQLNCAGPDFRSAPVTPYYPSFSDVCVEGDSSVLEIPMTIIYTKLPLTKEWGKNLYEKHKDRRIIRGLSRIFWNGQPQWFRPSPHVSAKQLISLVDTCNKRKFPIIEMMFHSSELLPGGSPYNPDAASVEKLYTKLAMLFSYLSGKVDNQVISSVALFYKSLRKSS